MEAEPREITTLKTPMMSTLDLAKLLTALFAWKINGFGRDFNEVTSLIALAASHLAKEHQCLKVKPVRMCAYKKQRCF